MIDRRPDPRRIQQLHVDGMAPDIRARKDHARATSRRVCTPSSVGRKIATPWRAARGAQGRKTVVRKDRTSPSTGRHYCSTGFVSRVPLFPEKHRGEDTHGKHGAHGHGSQLGGTVSNKVSKCRNTVRCVQVAQASKFLQVAIWVYLKGLPVHLGRLRVSPRDQAVGCLHACLLVATLLTTGPVVVRLAEISRDDNLSRT
jgi:hypothetical protein